MVMPIDIQTVLSQVTSVGKMQQQQQLAASEVQLHNRLEDTKKLKELDEQIKDVAQVDSIEVSDALNKDRNPQKGQSGHHKDEENGEDIVEEKKPKGRIIDTVG